MNKGLNRHAVKFIAVLLAVVLVVSGGLVSNGASAQESVTLTMTAWDVATTPYWHCLLYTSPSPRD